MLSPPWTTPEELKLLKENEDLFIQHKSSETMAAFFRTFFNVWFQRFPEIPRVFPGIYSKEELSPDQLKKLTKAFKTRHQQLKSWYSNHTAVKMQARERMTAPAPLVKVVPSKASRALQEVKDIAKTALTDEQKKKVTQVRRFTKDMYELEGEDIKSEVRNAVQEQREARKKLKEELATRGRTPPTARQRQEALKTARDEINAFFTDLNWRMGWIWTCVGGGPVPTGPTTQEIRGLSYHIGKNASGHVWQDVYPGYETYVSGPYGFFVKGIYNASTSTDAASSVPLGYSSTTIQPLSSSDLDIEIPDPDAAVPCGAAASAPSVVPDIPSAPIARITPVTPVIAAIVVPVAPVVAPVVPPATVTPTPELVAPIAPLTPILTLTTPVAAAGPAAGPAVLVTPSAAHTASVTPVLFPNGSSTGPHETQTSDAMRSAITLSAATLNVTPATASLLSTLTDPDSEENPNDPFSIIAS
ncbi:hypothetical protein CERSUDRAFT_99695 [Gelatoporia subvermispora B]|uniref:Uncharacterized protein n=1 Tax=Ceriporiopsis subvermispora (strain B) TaxID=914234 RepID=M2PA02_CERS8|nr:hypothetical protein CERSUDRAFT_99695 [Gelatoporia subvermispora B]